jgi:CheY-like chemotaxis protein
LIPCQDRRAAALDKRAVEYITQPFSPDNLMGFIEKYAEKNVA